MYNFSDWLEGKVVLASSYFVFNKKEKPIVAQLSDFSEDDQELIKSTLIEAFDKAVSSLLIGFKKHFKKEYNASKDKGNLLKLTIGQCNEILLGKVSNYGPFATCSFWNVTFTIQVLSEISNHYTNHILRGKPIDYYSFQIKGSPLFEGEENPIVYSQTIWEFMTWLQNAILVKNGTKSESKFDSNSKSDNDEMPLPIKKMEKVMQNTINGSDKKSQSRVAVSKEDQKLISETISKNLDVVSFESNDEKYFDTSEKFTIVKDLIKAFFVVKSGKLADLEFLFYKLKEVEILNQNIPHGRFVRHFISRFKLPKSLDSNFSKFHKRESPQREIVFKLCYDNYLKRHQE
jgi:hypothetical protein